MFHDFLEWQCEIGALSTQLCGRFLKAVNWELWLLTDHTLEVLHHAYAIFITMGTCFTLERTKKQYPSGSCTQDIYNFASSAVFTGHLMVAPSPPPPHPSLATPLFLKRILYLSDSNLLQSLFATKSLGSFLLCQIRKIDSDLDSSPCSDPDSSPIESATKQPHLIRWAHTKLSMIKEY